MPWTLGDGGFHLAVQAGCGRPHQRRPRSGSGWPEPARPGAAFAAGRRRAPVDLANLTGRIAALAKGLSGRGRFRVCVAKQDRVTPQRFEPGIGEHESATGAEQQDRKTASGKPTLWLHARDGIAKRQSDGGALDRGQIFIGGRRHSDIGISSRCGIHPIDRLGVSQSHRRRGTAAFSWWKIDDDRFCEGHETFSNHP